MIDSHCHLAGEEFVDDLAAVVARAQAAGVTRALVILAAEQDAEWARGQALAASWPAVRFAIGVHPHQAHLFAADPAAAAVAVAARLAGNALVRAIGEIGLDYHYDFSPRDVQQQVFAEQVRLARELGRPIVIHTREADEDTIAILHEAGQGDVRGVLHCFTGTPALARAGLDLGLLISVAGILTFPKASALRDTIRMVPIDRLLIETDSPFLAPAPLRGKRNEPAHVGRVADALATLHGLTPAAVASRTAANFTALFAP